MAAFSQDLRFAFRQLYMGCVLLLMMIVALVASSLPAVRAANADPTNALRSS